MADDTQTLADEFIDAGWYEWDLDDAFIVIDEALSYMDGLGSL
jgi:zona occludens toxin (predicted ATPase)